MPYIKQLSHIFLHLFFSTVLFVSIHSTPYKLSQFQSNLTCSTRSTTPPVDLFPLRQQNSSGVPDLGLGLHSTSLDGAGSAITNIVFGILALLVGMATIWQAYRAFQMWHPAMTGTTRPRCSYNSLSWLTTVVDIDLEASRVEEPETEAETPNEEGISSQPGTSHETQTSIVGGSDDSIGLPTRDPAELP